MFLLAIETSQHVGGIALRDLTHDQAPIDVEMLWSQKRHDDDLLPAIDRLFKRLKLRPSDLKQGALAVSIGPGGFTGLRIAVATAKMFAETLGVNIVAVPSALVAAEQYQGAGPIMIALASKADTAWCTKLEMVNRFWSIEGQPRLEDSQSLDLAGIQAMIADKHLPAALCHRCKDARIPIIEPVLDPRASLIVAQRMLLDGLITDPLKLIPLYPRQPEAVSLWEKKPKSTS